MIEYVDLEVARAAPGIRMVVASSVPSPWTEAAKGVFRLAGLPVKAVRGTDMKAVAAWIGVDNVPAVVFGAEPVRTSWAAIVGLAARLAPGTILPDDPAARADVFGAIELVAGDEGIGWSTRLAMVHAGLVSDGARGFRAPVSAYLARRYGYVVEDAPHLVDRVTRRFALLRERLGTRDYFGGASPNALDVYVATFLTLLAPISEEACPAMRASLRTAFAAAAEELGGIVARRADRAARADVRAPPRVADRALEAVPSANAAHLAVARDADLTGRFRA
jgi:glutathione S-transferase